MSKIITPDKFTEEEQDILNQPFEYSELAQTEAERLLREKPAVAQQLVEQYLKNTIKWDDFTPSERNLLLQVLIEKKAVSEGESTAIKALIEADYVRTPPSPEEFLDDPQYLGPIGKTIYPYWREHLLYALDPKNQVHEVAIKGSIGSGKCTHNSFIINNLGVLRVQELYARQDKVQFALSESGPRPITHFHDEGETETIKIKTYNGFDLECRPNHRIRVFDGKEIVWKESKDLSIGDQAVIVRKQNVWGTNPENLTVEEAELFGIITGDGCNTKNNLDITFGAREEDIPYINHVENNIVRQIPSIKYRLKKTTRKTGQELYRLNFYKEFRDRVQGIGFVGLAHEKKVPLCIRMGTKEIVAAFLRGYFDTDGTIYSNNNTLEITTCSEILSEEIQIILLNFGIRTRRKFKLNNYRGAWTVKIIGKESKEIFEREIGFNHPKKKALLRQHLSYKKTTWRHNDTEIIPIDPSVIEECRTNVRWKRVGLKQSRSMFVSTEGKQSFTYKALDKIVDKFGIEYLPPILKKIYEERYIFTPITSLTPSRNHCYDLTVEGDPSYISSGFISHNTYFAILSQMYKLCVLSCLRNIPAYFGLSESTKICFGLFTLSLSKAETALSSEFKNMIGLSPYFRNVFPLKKTVQIRRVLNSTGDDSAFYEVMLPKNLMLLMGSKLQHALSLAVISGIIDEMNFRTKRTVTVDEDEDSAVSLYNQIRSRISSRFHKLGSVPGILCVISSAKSNSDFMEAHIARIKNDPHALVIGGSQWDVLPDKYSKERFYVFVGNSKSSSRIIDEEEVKEYPPNSPNILSVPVDLKHFFDYDINSALREHAGIATSGMQLLFEDPLIISRGWDKERKNPFKVDQIELGLKSNNTLMDYIEWDEMFRDAGFAVVPRHHPSMLRVLHIDLSKSNDITGIAMGGVSSIVEKISKNPEGQYNVKQLSPEIWLDFAIGIKAPQGDQVDYEKLHQFIVFLRESRFKIRYITFDQYNSVGPMQMLIKNRFEVGNLSVDRNDLAYIYFRDMVINKSISMYRNTYLEKELIHLTHSYINGKAKVDHPVAFSDGSKGSKDVADAAAGVVFNAMELLTNPGKFPDTSNTELSKGIIQNLFPAMRLDELPRGNVRDEMDMMNDYAKFRSPFEK